MKPSSGVPPAKRSKTRAATPAVAVSLPQGPLPSLKIDPFLTKWAQNRLASGAGAEEFEAKLKKLGRYTAYQFLQEVMYSPYVSGELRMDAAKQILPYEKAKPTPALEMSGRTVEDFARAIRASVKAIDDCIEQP